MGAVCRESIGLPTTTTTITNKNNKNKNHARITRLTRFSHLLILIALGVVALVVAPVTTTAAIVGLTVAFAPPPPPPLVKQHDTPSNNGICNHDDGLRTRRNRARAPLGWNRRRSGVFALKASSASLADNNANSSTNSNTDTTTASNNNNNNKRNILILSHNVSPLVADGLFNPNNLLTHRIDVLARCINSALWVSNGIRTDTTVYVMLFPHNVTIEVRGEEVRDLNPDERSVALLLQRSLLADYDGSDVDVDIVCDGGDTNQQQQIIQTQQNQNQQKQRREAEINRLRQKQRTRPKTINPHKPGSLSKSEKRAFRIDRKAREAMVRRIIRHDCLRDDDDDDDDDDDATTTGERRSASGRQPPPRGFTVHRDDTLVARLEDLKLKSGHGHDGNGGGSQVLMLNEMGDPLGSVLGDLSHNNYLMTSNTNNKKEGYESTMPIITPVASMSTQTTPLATTSPASAIESTTSSYKLPQATTTTIILGDQIGYAPCDEKILAESVHAVRQVSLGPLSLLTSQCITIVHHYLDTYEALPL